VRKTRRGRRDSSGPSRGRLPLRHSHRSRRHRTARSVRRASWNEPAASLKRTRPRRPIRARPRSLPKRLGKRSGVLKAIDMLIAEGHAGIRRLEAPPLFTPIRRGHSMTHATVPGNRSRSSRNHHKAERFPVPPTKRNTQEPLQRELPSAPHTSSQFPGERLRSWACAALRTRKPGRFAGAPGRRSPCFLACVRRRAEAEVVTGLVTGCRGTQCGHGCGSAM